MTDTPTDHGGAPHVDGRPVSAIDAAQPVVVPEWLSNLAALSWRVLAIAGFVLASWLLASLLWTVTASIAVAVVVAAVFAPIVVRLRAQGRSRAAAAAIVWAVAMLVIAAVTLLLALAFLPYLGEVVANLQAGIARLQTVLASLDLPPYAGTAVRQVLDGLRTGAEGAGGGVASAAAGFVTVLVLATFLVFFFLKDGDRAWVWAFQALSDQKRERITAAGETALTRVGGYLRGTTILSGLIALTDLVFMLVLGVPAAVPLAVLVFLSGYIPYFGGIVTTFIILLVTYAALGPGPVVVMIVLIAIRNAILGYAVRPAVYGRTVSIHPALVLVVLPAGFQLAGIIGLFAAVPFTAVILAVASATVEIVTPNPRPQLPGMVPAWLDRVAQWSWRLLLGIGLVGVIVAICVAVPLVVIPVVVGTILAATLDPVVDWLMRRGQSRGKASAISIGGTFLVVTTLVLLALAVLAEQAVTTGTAVISGANSANAAAGGQLGLFAQAVETLGVQGVKAIISLAEAIGTIVLIALLGSLLAFYFMRDGPQLRGALVGRFRPEVEAEVDAAGGRAFEVLGGYMFGTAAISLVGATSQLVIMVVLGIPLALPIFVLSFFLCFIPYIGGFISTGAALLVTIAFGTPTDIAIMIVWTLVFNIVTGNIVGPLVYGKTVHVHPAVVLVAIPAGAAIAGILGMFLVVPAIGVVAATWRSVVRILGAGAASPDPQADPRAGPGPEAPPALPGSPPGPAGLPPGPAGSPPEGDPGAGPPTPAPAPG